MFTPQKNPSPEQIRDIIAASKHAAARRIVDVDTGDVWVWPFEQATHLEGAAQIGAKYIRPPGGGDVLV
jgi:hypothetical protein